MDALIKLVTTALEWTYQAGDTAVTAATLEQAAELLMLRRDTLWIIDGAGPSIVALPAASTGPSQASETVAAQVSSPQAPPPSPPAGPTAQVEQARSRTATTSPSILSTTCTFSGVVPIALTRFLERAVSLVECPDGAATRTLTPHGGVLRFTSHAKRKTTTPNTGQRWARGETAWAVVGGEGDQ